MTWDHLHDEDILFEFRGSEPDALTPGRFYRGTVDGFAEFGVFITIGESVTGLLHRSKLPHRLESLDWSPGEDVIVQVEGVRDNGNVDLDWSIRQTPREFRAEAVDGPEADEDAETTTEPAPEPATPPTPPEEASAAEGDGAVVTAPRGLEAVSRARTDELSELTGERVRLEGEITAIRQTSGPTVFSLEDTAGEVECAAFEAPGERAYPAISEHDVVQLVGVVEHHRGAVQLETESIERLDEEAADEIRESIKAAEHERAIPSDQSLLVSDPALESCRDAAVTVATRLRAAAYDGRPIVIRHPSRVDGVIAGAAIEHALATLRGAEDEATYATARDISRRPTRDPWYDLSDAMYDVGRGWEDEEAMIVLVGMGTTAANAEALELHDIYDVDRVVVDTRDTEEEVSRADAAVVGPETMRVTTLAATVAGMVCADLRSVLAPLPAVSYGDAVPDRYAQLAAEHGVDRETALERHQALALFSGFHPHDDKRELIHDLLFDGDEAAALAGHVSAQYRERIDTAVETAMSHTDRIDMVGRTIGVVDAEIATHRFDFPPSPVLAAEMRGAVEGEHGLDVVIVLGRDEAFIAGNTSFSLDALAEEIADHVPAADVSAMRDRLTFLAGEREDVRGALVEVLALDEP